MLLDQSLFVVDRPRTRLARQYRELADAIARNNLADREGALAYLRANLEESSTSPGHPTEVPAEDPLPLMRATHAHDGEVLFCLAGVYQLRGEIDDALQLVNDAIREGYSETAALSLRAHLHQLQGHSMEAVSDFRSILDRSDAPLSLTKQAVSFLVSLGPDSLQGLAKARAVAALPFAGKCWVLEWVLRETLLPVADSLVRDLVDEAPKQTRSFRELPNSLVLALVRFGLLETVLQNIGDVQPPPESLAIAEAFNFAMGRWASTGTPPVSYFARVIALDAAGSGQRNKDIPNYAQCLAISQWAIDDKAASAMSCEAALRTISSRGNSFSAWRFLVVGASEFKDDVQAMLTAVRAGEALRPAFFQPAISRGT
jgi:hypothetical protein